MKDLQPSLTEFAVLGLLAEGRTHGFAISKVLASDGSVGRILTVRRPLVYRALDRLVEAGLAEAVDTEPGTAGPNRVVHRITPAGRRRLIRWLGKPVDHIRDLRIEFQLKLTLLQRSRKSALSLIRRQRLALMPTLVALDLPTATIANHVELWRQHNASAADAFLSHLERLWAADA
ncbi:MAG: PadR family transcriptional regulator [Actinomycetota bacterium]